MSYIRRLTETFQRYAGQPSPDRAGKAGRKGDRPGGDAPSGDRPLLIRVARDDDLPRLRDLAALDGAPPLMGPALIAFVEDEAWAAVSLGENRVIADPFRPSAPAVALLRVRSAQLESEPMGRRPAVGPRAVWRRARA